jgi:hypothetical protein
MSAKNITVEYVEDLCARIEQGEMPRKINALARKEFVRQMLPHVKIFLEQGYTYKEIADFLGHISASDLKKAVAKDAPVPTQRKQPKAVPEKTVPALIAGTKSKGRKGPQPGA